MKRSQINASQHRQRLATQFPRDTAVFDLQVLTKLPAIPSASPLPAAQVSKTIVTQSSSSEIQPVAISRPSSSPPSMPSSSSSLSSLQESPIEGKTGDCTITATATIPPSSTMLLPPSTGCAEAAQRLTQHLSAQGSSSILPTQRKAAAAPQRLKPSIHLAARAEKLTQEHPLPPTLLSSRRHSAPPLPTTTTPQPSMSL